MVIQSQQLRQIGGHQALEAFTSITDLAGNQIRGQMAIVKYGNDTILLQALAPSASWGKYGPTFKAMVASIGLE